MRQIKIITIDITNTSLRMKVAIKLPRKRLINVKPAITTTGRVK
jgi:hypothetical protein